ncbi:MAG TPA: hypothetical protein DF613_06030 [Lachnospiraceae bacterium]|nr:hypothetical protein [Lachnospiraceae bacterium]
MRKKCFGFLKRRVLSLALASVILLTGCGGREEQAEVPSEVTMEAVESVAGPGEAPAAEAATMHLQKTEGSVDVADGEGAEVPLLEQMGLYSGYQVDTREESYAWIDLDSVKLTKMDVNSRVGVRKDGKKLGIYVHRGSLYFHVTEPLGADESLDIRTSNMMVGIRGTCGWVDAADPAHVKVGILEGTVSCSAGSGPAEVPPDAAVAEPAVDEPNEPGAEELPPVAGPDAADTVTETVSGGSIAELSFTEDGQPQFTVRKLTVKDIPDFALSEVTQDPELCEKILAETGLDVLNGDQPDWTAALEGIAYYGDVAQCAMTREQAEAFAEVLRRERAVLEENYGQISGMPEYDALVDGFGCYAGLFDPGNGVPVLMLGGGALAANPEATEDGAYIIAPDTFPVWEIWQYVDGEAIQWTGEDLNLSREYFYLYPDHIVHGGNSSDGSIQQANVYRFDGGFSTGVPDTTAMHDGRDMDNYWNSYSIDGSPASMQEYDLWQEEWGASMGTGSLAFASTALGIQASGTITGFCPAEDVLAALENTQE